MKYQPVIFGVLTQDRNPVRTQCMVGSLTGADSYHTVTEERDGTLSTVGNRKMRVKA